MVQSVFSPGPILIGGFADSETPDAFGPRNMGQDGVAAWVAIAHANINKKRRVADFMNAMG